MTKKRSVARLPLQETWRRAQLYSPRLFAGRESMHPLLPPARASIYSKEEANCGPLHGVVDSGVASAKLVSSSPNYCPAPLPCKVLVSYHPPTLLRPSASIGAFDAYRSSC